MQRPTAIADTLQQHWGTIEPNAVAIERNPQSTIEPPMARLDTHAGRAVALLRALGVERSRGTPLDLRETFAEGGMGVLRLARQVAVGREVAVKTLKPEHRSPASVLRLLREAWVTGSLEHPNVVPIYDVAVDAEGNPLVVLKRIEGLEWTSLMRDAAAIRERFGEPDAREWNLRVLVQVCNAVHFAHSRGILHRDLKPENVMIGAFGEVYVVDWGIAVSLRDDAEGRLPLASEARDLAGTPAYMAPEMLGGDAVPLSERTDVYLLGAILYEILAGRPPHRGTDLVEIMTSVVLSEPEMPRDAPSELAAVCRRAMARNPDERFGSAEELRRSIEEHLGHRASMRLTESAQDRLEELLEELRVADDPAAIDRLFIECRFGFRAALDAWSGNQAARGGLRLALLRMAEHEIETGDVKAAAKVIAEIGDPPEDLKERLHEAERRRDAEARKVDELRALERDLDPRVGSRTRTFITLVLGLLWTVSPAYMYAAGIPPTRRGSTVLVLFFLLVVAAFGVWARESIMKSQMNRTLGALVAFVLFAQIVLNVGTWIMGLEPIASLTISFFLWFATGFSGVIFVDRRLLPATVGYGVAFFLVASHPELAFAMMSLCHLVLTVNAVWIWRPLFTFWRR